MSGASNISTVLETEDFNILFGRYLEQIFANELLDFYNEVEKFKRIKDAHTTVSKAKSIFGMYLCPTAPRQINVSGAEMSRLRKSMGEDESWDNTLFNSIQEEIVGLMDTLLAGFKKSTIWNDRVKIADIKKQNVKAAQDSIRSELTEALKKREKSDSLSTSPPAFAEPQGMTKSNSTPIITYNALNTVDLWSLDFDDIALTRKKSSRTLAVPPPQQRTNSIWERPTLSLSVPTTHWNSETSPDVSPRMIGSTILSGLYEPQAELKALDDQKVPETQKSVERERGRGTTSKPKHKLFSFMSFSKR